MTMLPHITLLLLMGLSVHTVAGDCGQELTFSREEEPWVTVTFQGASVPSIQSQKRSKSNQFFALMGKQVRGVPPIQPEGRIGYLPGRMISSLLGRRQLSTEGSYGQETPEGRATSGAVARGLQSHGSRLDPPNQRPHAAISHSKEDNQGSK